MINKVILKGNIGKKPHIALDQRGREIASFSLATNTKWKDGSGEWHQHVDWHQIVIFRDSTVRWIKDVLKKGDTVYIEGKLSSHNWTDKYNQPRTDSAVIIAGSEGKVEYLRSKDPTSSQNNEFQEHPSDEVNENSPSSLKQETENN